MAARLGMKEQEEGTAGGFLLSFGFTLPLPPIPPHSLMQLLACQRGCNAQTNFFIEFMQLTDL